MKTNLTDAQFSTLIGTVARVPITDARRLFFELLEAASYEHLKREPINTEKLHEREVV